RRAGVRRGRFLPGRLPGLFPRRMLFLVAEEVKVEIGVVLAHRWREIVSRDRTNPAPEALLIRTRVAESLNTKGIALPTVKESSGWRRPRFTRPARGLCSAVTVPCTPSAAAEWAPSGMRWTKSAGAKSRSRSCRVQARPAHAPSARRPLPRS